MKVYVVVVDDTHSDTEPYVFSTSPAAIDYAKKVAIESAYDIKDIQYDDIPGWLFYARYSPDSKVWVLEVEVDSVY